jgi:hypothetical protein
MISSPRSTSWKVAKTEASIQKKTTFNEITTAVTKMRAKKELKNRLRTRSCHAKFESQL